jgi:hypothetical protein
MGWMFGPWGGCAFRLYELIRVAIRFDFQSVLIFNPF